MSLKSFLPAVAWFLISVYLLVVPNNDLPHSKFFNIPFFDKYVHFTMFLVLTTLFCFPFLYYPGNDRVIRTWFTRVAIFVVVYGIVMEFVQKWMGNGRSFDLVDIVFDSLGSIVGLLLISGFFGKKIGPNRNRGRNQN